MHYIGKSLDTFEMAFAQMLECFGIPQILFLDCISLRCFGVNMGNTVKEWFRPSISIPQSIARISETVGLSLICRPLAREEISFFSGKGLLLGPITNHVAVQELRDYYYCGAENYLFCRTAGKNMFELFDPRGYVGLRLSEEQLQQILSEETALCTWPESVNCMQISPAYILEYGLCYHEKIREDEYRQMERAAQGYTYTRGHTISLQYGVINYLLQLDKVFKLGFECGLLTSRAEERYMEEKQALYALARQETITDLPYIVDRIWGILEHGR